MPEENTLDSDLAALRCAARTWVLTPLVAKRTLLETLRTATAAVAPEWVRASCHGKGIDPASPSAGEEWMSGPYALLSYVSALFDLLGQLDAGRNPLDRGRVRTLPTGQLAIRAFPTAARDLVLAGYSADVWLRPGVSLAEAQAGVARRLRDTTLPGEVALVLGAGNINSIPPLDVLTKLYQDNAVVLLKISPVNAYLSPILTRVFAAFIEEGFVRITAGDAELGGRLVRHPDVDTVHITGSRTSFDTIVFGPGAAGAQRKHRHEPVVTKPMTSELGGVGPVIVVPGHWSDRSLRLQANNIVTQRLHNSGFNCIATQLVVLAHAWPQADTFLRFLRQALRDAPERPAYYPGAADRQRAAVHSHPGAELFGGDSQAPRTLLPDVDPTDPDETAFSTEYFGPVLAVTRLPGGTPAEFLHAAVDFCNGRVAGTLGAGLVAAPLTLRGLGPQLSAAIGRLRYGTVAVNCWVGPVYAMPRATWGAFPGHDLYDVGSGMGIVHNAMLLDPEHVERTVGRGPFRPWPTPVWSITNATAQHTGRHMTRFAAEPHLGKALPSVLAALVSSLRG